MRALRRRARDAHDLLLYLVTSPNANFIGLFTLPVAYAAEDLVWRPGRVKRALQLLVQEDLIGYDEAAGVIYVGLLLDWQPIRTESQAVGAVNRLEALPPTLLLDRFRKDLLARHHAELSQKIRPLLEFLGLTPPLTGSHTPTVTPPVTPTPSPSPSTSPSQSPSPSPSQSPGPFQAPERAAYEIALSNSSASHNGTAVPRTPSEQLFEDEILPLTQEAHRRDEWLTAVATIQSRLLAVKAVEETRAAVEKGTVRNAGAYLWARFQELCGTTLGKSFGPVAK